MKMQTGKKKIDPNAYLGEYPCEVLVVTEMMYVPVALIKPNLWRLYFKTFFLNI